MKNELWYKEPAKVWQEALPVGNGHQGAMVWGGIEKETLSLNEDTLWSGTVKDKNKKGASAYLESVRTFMKNGDISSAEDYINRYMLGDMSETYLPFGEIIIENHTVDASTVTGYSRKLDLSEGIFRSEYLQNGSDRVSETVFASYPDKLIVVKIESEKPLDIDVFWTCQLRYRTYTEKSSFIEGYAPIENLPFTRSFHSPSLFEDENNVHSIRTCGAFRIISDGNVEYVEGKGIVKQANNIEIRISLATSFISPFRMPTANAKKKCKKALSDTKNKTYQDLLKTHTADHTSLFSRVDISLGDDVIMLPTDKRLMEASKSACDPGLYALLFQYGRYMMISASRKGSRATNLQGIWNGSMHPPWCSNYTIDMNTEMNYWAVDSANLSECMEPLTKYIYELSVNGRKTAKTHYNCRGWVSHSNSDIWAYTTSCGPCNTTKSCSLYAQWPMSSGWLCRHLYDHYLYTRDKEYLKDTALPIMLGAARFYIDFMYEDESGHLVTSPSLSPENFYIGADGGNHAADIMPAMDRAIIHELFSNCIEGAKETGYECGFIDELKEALKKIPPLQIGKYGQLMEWSKDYEEGEPKHRHTAHLYALHPSNMITPEKTPELAKACETALLRRGFESTGWAIIWRTCMWARLKNSENAYKIIKQLIRFIPHDAAMACNGGGLYQNLFDACPPFQIDGNFGVISAISEMLYQDHTGKLDLLPALPKEWPCGYLKGVRLRNGKCLDMTWKDCKVTESRIY